MPDSLNHSNVETWQVRKPAITASHGIVASQHHAASQVGAQVLSDGGNAVDAIVAASLMIGTVEPWMSGLGGGGFMLYYDAESNQTHSLEFGMRAPLAAKPADYPLVDGQDGDLFSWPSVKDNRNVLGPMSIATPGYLAGISTAVQQFGTRSFADLITPAVESARSGMLVDWYATLKITAAAAGLSLYPESASTYLPNGFAPASEWGGPMQKIRLGQLANTLERLREHGPEDFYHGELANQICADVESLGGSLRINDLSSYSPKIGIADQHSYRSATIYAAPGMSAGPTLRDALDRLETNWQPSKNPDAATFGAYADALKDAYKNRLATMGDIDDASNPACTTHLSCTDARGNMVTLTQTLLSVFGSKVMLPQSGILMNNGMMWFDPRAGQANSMSPGKRPLSNMCPTLFKTASGERYALGASGGRKIMPAVMQLISLIVDYDLDIDEAMHHGRIDVSGTPFVYVDEKLGSHVIESLAKNHAVVPTPNGVYPALFACPNIVQFGTDGQQSGSAYVMSPWASVAAANATR
jgi:gamma-glutamyltranspeptidase/glutathione hydrolase